MKSNFIGFFIIALLIVAVLFVFREPSEDWDVRYSYTVNDIEVFKVFPQPEQIAGEYIGTIIHFNETFETFKNKELAIFATHRESGKRITITEQVVSEYVNFERFTISLEVPLAGLWKYEFYLNDEFYGDIILSINEDSEL
ncbi:hypothetical protein [Evansella clarkii]|uniref:hypothetical protein n=1 Tax=Evansella clarkii TaxID=79879 RepID=UPI000B42FD38|nr:hypothetical protein [Evansella clarkii]